jgi:hypothetical protein
MRSPLSSFDVSLMLGQSPAPGMADDMIQYDAN